MTYSSRMRWMIATAHVLFWIGVLIGFAYLSRNYRTSTIFIVLQVGTEVFCQAALSYINIYLLLPRLFKSRHYVFYLISIILVYFALYDGRVLLLKYITDGKMGWYFYYASYLPLVGFFLLSSSFWFASSWFEAKRKEVELSNIQLDTELKFLKLQLNPHFLFNTLNNIYSLTLLKSDQAPNAVMKLSEMMRHMIYDSQDAITPLSKEVDFIENFIELQRIKVRNPPLIKFTKEGIRDRFNVAPLIFLAFLENSFKHGPQGAIDIELTMQGSMLYFKVVNEIPKYQSTQREKSGVGLANVKKRLELIYPKKHELVMKSDDKTYCVTLSLNLS